MAGLPLPYLVTGPGRGKRCASYGAATATALDYCMREHRTYYVRDDTEKVVGRAEFENEGATWVEVAA